MLRGLRLGRNSGASPPAPPHRREVIVVALAASLLSLAMHWPLPAHLGRDVSPDLGDPLIQAWQVAWGGHALLSQPLDYFQANAYWPLRNSLAFSDALVGYAPAGLVGRGVEAAVVRYNLLFLFAYALAFIGPYVLARELGVGRLGAAVAGAAFAYAPWRLDQDGHLQVISSGGIALCLFLLVRGYRRRRPGIVLAGWLVATWQFLLGFTLGLQLVYLLGVIGVVLAAAWIKQRTRPAPAVVRATMAGLVVFVLAAIVVSRPYLQVFDDHPEARRSESLVARYSPPLRSYVAAPEGNLVWGGPTAPIRAGLLFPGEQSLFPGAATLALAGLGLLSTAYPRWLRAVLALAALLCGLLALGFSQRGFRLPLEPYRLLYEHAPGWDAVRTPGRLTTLTSLALALLAAAGAHAVVRALGRRSARRRARLAGAALIGAVLIEGAGFHFDGEGDGLLAGRPHPTVPRAPSGQRGVPAPQLHLPLGRFEASRYLIWSTDGFPALLNGQGSFGPRWVLRVEAHVRRFPDRPSVRWLRSHGVRTVVLHPDLAAGTRWKGAAHRAVRGLPLEREVRGGVVVYALAPR